MKKIFILIVLLICVTKVYPQIYSNNFVSEINSSKTALGSSATFTGGWEDVSNYTSITTIVRSNRASAADGIKWQFSTNRSNADNFAFATYAAGDTLTNSYTVPVKAKWFRVIYTNTASAQTYFRLQTIFSHGSVLNSYFTGTIGAVTQAGTWNINNITGTVSLPTGASTLSEQQTHTTRLDSALARLSRILTKFTDGLQTTNLTQATIDSIQAGSTTNGALETTQLWMKNLIVAAVDSALGLIKTSDQTPNWARYSAEEIRDATNDAAATNYYPSSTGASMDGYKNLSFTGKLVDADNTSTITWEITNDEDLTNADWIQTYVWDRKGNAAVNQIQAVSATTTFAVDFIDCNFSAYRVKVVTGDATNTVIIKQRRQY
jgi:hypothetical protein